MKWNVKEVAKGLVAALGLTAEMDLQTIALDAAAGLLMDAEALHEELWSLVRN